MKPVAAADQMVERIDSPGMKRPGNNQVQETDPRRSHGRCSIFFHESMKRACLVCGGKFGPSRILLTCEKCKFTTANLTLSEEQLRQLYTADYFTGNEYRDYVADRLVIEKQFRLRLRKLLQLVPDPR